MALELSSATFKITQNRAKEIVEGKEFYYFESFTVDSKGSVKDFQVSVQDTISEYQENKLYKVSPVKIGKKWYIEKIKGFELPKFTLNSKSKNDNLTLIKKENNKYTSSFEVKVLYQWEEIIEKLAIALALNLDQTE